MVGYGVCCVGGLLTSLLPATFLPLQQAQQSEVSSKLQSIDRYMSYKKLPGSLRARILSFFRFQANPNPNANPTSNPNPNPHLTPHQHPT